MEREGCRDSIARPREMGEKRDLKALERRRRGKGFPGGASGKESSCQCRRLKEGPEIGVVKGNLGDPRRSRSVGAS